MSRSSSGSRSASSHWSRTAASTRACSRSLGNLASLWGLAAFFVGYRAASWRQGAFAGALTLVMGVATYYNGGVVRGYVVNSVPERGVDRGRTGCWTDHRRVRRGGLDPPGATTGRCGGGARGHAGGGGALPPDRPPGLGLELVGRAISPARSRRRHRDARRWIVLPWVFVRTRVCDGTLTSWSPPAGPSAPSRSCCGSA